MNRYNRAVILPDCTNLRKESTVGVRIAPRMAIPRALHTATLLVEGAVLTAGGVDDPAFLHKQQHRLQEQ